MYQHVFLFDTINKVVPISSIKRDFPKEIVSGLKDMVSTGEIRPLQCFTNAVNVAKYLISQGYTNIKLVDGTYRNLRYIRFGSDWHRFIQYERVDGTKRYYDATVEFLNYGGGTWSWEYKAIRIFALSEIIKYHEAYCEDKEWACSTFNIPKWEDYMISTLKNEDYCSGYCLIEHSLNPHIDNKGNYVGYHDNKILGEICHYCGS